MSRHSLSKKERKARAEAAAKAATGEQQEQPEVIEDEQEAEVAEPQPAEEEAQPRSKTKSKKRKASDLEAPESTTPTQPQDESAQPLKPSKRSKKTPSTNETDADAAAPTDSSKQRFIVFIGNLPFTATTEQIQTHFKAVRPSSIRHITDKNTKKSKGYAFLEFDAYDRLKTCLKLYHHSIFGETVVVDDHGNRVEATTPVDDNVNGFQGNLGPSKSAARGKGQKKKEGRRINVELTAGGGGSKSEGRKEKLKVKNEKLNEQRKRRMEQEAKEKVRKEKKGAGKGANAAPLGEKGQAEKEEGGEDGEMHPARRRMLGM